MCLMLTSTVSRSNWQNKNCHWQVKFGIIIEYNLTRSNLRILILPTGKSVTYICKVAVEGNEITGLNQKIFNICWFLEQHSELPIHNMFVLYTQVLPFLWTYGFAGRKVTENNLAILTQSTVVHRKCPKLPTKLWYSNDFEDLRRAKRI